MPVDSRHPSYSHHIENWQKYRDAYIGAKAVKARGQTYLLKPGGFEDAHYTRYKHRAKFYGGTKRTVGGSVGAVFRKELTSEGSALFDKHSENITLTGISLGDFCREAFREVLLIGRYGVLVDMPDGQSQPVWAGFPAESITNWGTHVVDGQERLRFVVLREMREAQGRDQFELEAREVYRVHYINDDGVYTVDVYESSGAGQGALTLTEQFIPTRRRVPLDFIPFQIFGSENLSWNIGESILSDLIEVNYAYYMHSADYEHGLYLTGVPTPVVTGHADKDDVMTIGGMVAWILPSADAKAYFLEYQGMGLQSHERAMDNDKKEMATLGARLLEETPEVQETLGAAQMRHSGDTGNLVSLSRLVSEGLTRVSQMHHWWLSGSDVELDPNVSIALNTDLVSARLAPDALLALSSMLQQGQISVNTFLYNLQQGEILPPGVTPDEEKTMLEIEAPTQLEF